MKTLYEYGNRRTSHIKTKSRPNTVQYIDYIITSINSIGIILVPQPQQQQQQQKLSITYHTLLLL